MIDDNSGLMLALYKPQAKQMKDKKETIEDILVDTLEYCEKKYYEGMLLAESIYITNKQYKTMWQNKREDYLKEKPHTIQLQDTHSVFNANEYSKQLCNMSAKINSELTRYMIDYVKRTGVFYGEEA